MSDRRDEDGPPRRDSARPQRAGTLSRRMARLGPQSPQQPVGSPPVPRPAPRQLAARPRGQGELVPAPAPRWSASHRRGLELAGNHSAQFHPHTLALEDDPRSPIHGFVLVTIAAMLASAMAWAWFGHISMYTSAPGKVQTAGRSKVVEVLAKGRVQTILAHDGDTVKAGEPLVQLDATDAAAARAIVADKLADARAEVARETMEIAASRADTVDPSTKIAWDKDVPAAVRAREDGVARADLAKLAAQIATLRAQKTQREAERDKYARNIEAQKALVAVTQENLTMIETLMKQGFNSQAKYLDMKAQLDDQQVMQTSFEGSLANAKQAILVVDSEIAKAREVFVATRTQSIAEQQQAIVDLAQQLVRADRTLALMTLRAPVDGVIHASAVTTLGQVLRPGQQVMQIVPSSAPLEIEAYVTNADIGFIRKGDVASVKIDAYTYNIYGSIEATVTEVANDALKLQGKDTVQTASLDGAYGSQSSADKTGNLQYPIHLRSRQNTMLVEGKQVPLVPGMLVNVEIETEKLRAIDYVLSPIEALLSTAGHER